MSDTKATPIDLTECEFERSCDNCDEPAIAFVVLAHTSNNGCPNKGKFYCQTHYQDKYEWMTGFTMEAVMCPLCLQHVSKNFSENFKAVRL